MNRILLHALGALVLTLGMHRSAIGQISILSPLSDDRTAVVGETYDGSILIRNDTADPQPVKIYQSDYQFFADGSNLFESPGSQPRSNADWVSISDSRLMLLPNQTVSLYYEVTIPPSDSLTACGTYWSALFIEAISVQSPESALLQDERQARLSTQTTLRYGIQLASHLDGDCQTGVAFDLIKLEETEGGERVIDIHMDNTGEVMVRPLVWIELFGGQDESRRLEGQMRRMYPGTSVSQRFDVSDVPPGEYTVLIVADAGGEALFGTQVALSL